MSPTAHAGRAAPRCSVLPVQVTRGAPPPLRWGQEAAGVPPHEFRLRASVVGEGHRNPKFGAARTDQRSVVNVMRWLGGTFQGRYVDGAHPALVQKHFRYDMIKDNVHLTEPLASYLL